MMNCRLAGIEEVRRREKKRERGERQSFLNGCQEAEPLRYQYRQRMDQFHKRPFQNEALFFEVMIYLFCPKNLYSYQTTQSERKNKLGVENLLFMKHSTFHSTSFPPLHWIKLKSYLAHRGGQQFSRGVLCIKSQLIHDSARFPHS